ncbi:hypothetical protein BS78_03G231400 [Paspalum vaginatum]|nr:hypothetical protein BS78_03G231400 [Paspalum vaginatum]
MGVGQKCCGLLVGRALRLCAPRWPGLACPPQPARRGSRLGAGQSLPRGAGFRLDRSVSSPDPRVVSAMGLRRIPTGTKSPIALRPRVFLDYAHRVRARSPVTKPTIVFWQGKLEMISRCSSK